MDSSANHTKVFLIVPHGTKVQIVRAQVPRKILVVLTDPHWYQKLKELPKDVFIDIKRSEQPETLKDEQGKDGGLVMLLSAMDAMLRRYDGLNLESLFEKHALPRTRPVADHERGRLRTRRQDSPSSRGSPGPTKPASDSSGTRSTRSETASPQAR